MRMLIRAIAAYCLGVLVYYILFILVAIQCLAGQATLFETPEENFACDETQSSCKHVRVM